MRLRVVILGAYVFLMGPLVFDAFRDEVLPLLGRLIQNSVAYYSNMFLSVGAQNAEAPDRPLEVDTVVGQPAVADTSAGEGASRAGPRPTLKLPLGLVWGMSLRELRARTGRLDDSTLADLRAIDSLHAVAGGAPRGCRLVHARWPALSGNAAYAQATFWKDRLLRVRVLVPFSARAVEGMEISELWVSTMYDAMEDSLPRNPFLQPDAILRGDSPGGTPVAGEEAAQHLLSSVLHELWRKYGPPVARRVGQASWFDDANDGGSIVLLSNAREDDGRREPFWRWTVIVDYRSKSWSHLMTAAKEERL